MPRILLLVLVLSAALAGCAGRQVQLVAENEFNLMARRIAPVLQQREIIDANGAYVSSFLKNSLPAQPGDILFRRLSPAFRFRVDPALLPSTFAASKTAADSVQMLPDGFVLRQGMEDITVKLLAAVDWNGDSVDDWMILCRVKNIHNGGLRDYYLVVEKTDTPIIKPRLIAVYDCINKSCQLFITVNKPASKQEFEPESPVIDVEAGDRNITLPPGAPVPDSAPKETLKEQRISG